jgi:hypothetical protein
VAPKVHVDQGIPRQTLCHKNQLAAIVDVLTVKTFMQT